MRLKDAKIGTRVTWEHKAMTGVIAGPLTIDGNVPVKLVVKGEVKYREIPLSKLTKDG